MVTINKLVVKFLVLKLLMSVYVIDCERTWCRELGPFVLGQLKNIEGSLQDLNPVPYTSFLERCNGVSRLDQVSERKERK